MITLFRREKNIFIILALFIFILAHAGCTNNFELLLKDYDKNSNTANLYKVDSKSNETLIKEIQDIRSIYYYEIHNRNLYIIRRIGYDGTDDKEWTDELWKYDYNGESNVIYSTQGGDFKVSPNEKYIAFKDHERLLILDSNGKIINEYDYEDFKADDFEFKYIHLEKWSQDNKFFWLNITSRIIAKIDVENDVITTFDISDTPIINFDINTEKSLLIGDDYPKFIEIGQTKKFMEKENTISLYLYNLETKELSVLNNTINKRFEAYWIDENTVEYNDTKSENRITYKITE